MQKLSSSVDARAAFSKQLYLPDADETSQGDAIKDDFQSSFEHIEAARQNGAACLGALQCR
jgi:hypothetical protein